MDAFALFSMFYIVIMDSAIITAKDLVSSANNFTATYRACSLVTG